MLQLLVFSTRAHLLVGQHVMQQNREEHDGHQLAIIMHCTQCIIMATVSVGRCTDNGRPAPRGFAARLAGPRVTWPGACDPHV